MGKVPRLCVGIADKVYALLGVVIFQFHPVVSCPLELDLRLQAQKRVIGVFVTPLWAPYPLYFGIN